MNQPEPEGYSRYEILKIWVPTHGVINIYRKPRGGEGEFLQTHLAVKDIHTNLSIVLSTEYHVDNGFMFEEPINLFGVERLRVLASHGSVIEITRDQSVPELQNKYTIEPSLSMEQYEVTVKDRPR